MSTQKTIRLDEKYRINPESGEVEAFASLGTGYYPDYSAPDFQAELAKCEAWGWYPTPYRVGAAAVLWSRTDVSPNAIRAGASARYGLDFDPEGIPGNSDRHCKRTTGWRGTTDDQAVYAHGLCRITRIRPLKSGAVAVTVRSVD